MGELNDRLSAISVEARSPDGWIHASVRGRAHIEVCFGSEVYRSYTETQLAHQLAQLAAVLCARHQRHQRDVIDQYLGDTIVDDEDPRARLYQERLSCIEVTGTSPSGTIQCASRGLTHWDFGIVSGTIRRVSEDAFRADLHTAVANLLADHRAAVILLKDEIFGLDLPAGPVGGTRAVYPATGHPATPASATDGSRHGRQW